MVKLKRAARRFIRRKRRMGVVKRFVKKGARLGATNKRKRQATLGTFFPERAVMRHKYVHTYEITSVAGALTGSSFRCNDMRQPSDLGATHQPLGFDQMNALYDHFTVIGSQIKVKVVPKATNEDAFRVALYKDDDSTLLSTSMDHIAEMTPSKVRTSAANANYPVTLREKFSLKKQFGGTGLLNNSRFLGDGINSPTELTHYAIMIQTMTAVDATAIISVEVDYIAVWTELKAIAQS